ncbi:hypothetical protein [Nocardia inohanensis]|nr:hypothetical protein [Nocardia inohanensis]
MKRLLLALLFGTAIVLTALHSLAEGAAVPRLTCNSTVLGGTGTPPR